MCEDIILKQYTHKIEGEKPSLEHGTRTIGHGELPHQHNEAPVTFNGDTSCDQVPGKSLDVQHDKSYDNQGYSTDAKDRTDNTNDEPLKSVRLEVDVGVVDLFEQLPPPRGVPANVHTVRTILTDHLQHHWRLIKWTLILLCLVGYFVYFGFAMAYEFGSEPSIRLLWVTCAVVFCIVLHLVWKYFHKHLQHCVQPCTPFMNRHGQLLLWVVLLLLYIAVFTFLLVDLFYVTQQPYNLVSLGGLTLLLAFCFIFSYSPGHVNWRAVLWGIALQFVFALIILRWTWGYNAFQWLGDRVSEFLAHADAGAEFVFGPSFRDHFIAFVVLPVVVFFSTVISILYYLGVMQAVIQKVGWVLQNLMGTTAGESLNAAGNIFIGQAEAPLMIRPLLKDMTRSEIHAVMTGGFATIAGSVMAGYILFGVPANHLISASVMSAPAALAIAKLFYPETQVSKTTAEGVKAMEKSKDRNIIEAASSGAFQSIILVASIAVNLIAFVSLLHFLNSTLTWFGHRVGWEDPPLTFELICSYLLYPLAVVMGASLENCRIVAELVGVKAFINEFVAYEMLGVFINNRRHYNEHITVNGSYAYEGSDIILYNYTETITPDQDPKFHQTFVLERGILTDRTEVISTYALCGFANFGSVGIVLGTLSAMAPSRRSDIARVALRAMLAGNIACFTTACIAGLFYTGEPQ